MISGLDVQFFIRRRLPVCGYSFDASFEVLDNVLGALETAVALVSIPMFFKPDFESERAVFGR